MRRNTLRFFSQLPRVYYRMSRMLHSTRRLIIEDEWTAQKLDEIGGRDGTAEVPGWNLTRHPIHRNRTRGSCTGAVIFGSPKTDIRAIDPNTLALTTSGIVHICHMIPGKWAISFVSLIHKCFIPQLIPPKGVQMEWHLGETIPWLSVFNSS